ncbi:MAG TPA: hypothetical protein VER03_07560, partial [Bryobacteraceae bacterium]|nr:hypothetical protein [Bryobacteraceae bacterium]
NRAVCSSFPQERLFRRAGRRQGIASRDVSEGPQRSFHPSGYHRCRGNTPTGKAGVWFLRGQFS